MFTYKSLLSIVISSLYLAHGFSLNNYFDAAIDRHINKEFFPSGQISNKKLLAFSYALFSINCFISYKISVNIVCLVVLGSATCLIYSAPLLRLKKNTLLNIILNSLGFSIIFLIGFTTVSNSITPAALMMTMLFAIVFIPLQIVHQISHSEADKIENIQSVYNRFGFERAALFLNLSLVLLMLWSLLISVIYREYVYIFYLTSLLCFFFFYSLRRIKNNKKPYHESAVEARLLLRKICVLYGISIFFFFYFTK
ncbi:MAG: UbiA family prenyltransferase [Candidatus Omnitrophica bacterium]|nr:UbiA family prenyltransferase [Candidatus Omnitrophota bacterium]